MLQERDLRHDRLRRPIRCYSHPVSRDLLALASRPSKPAALDRERRRFAKIGVAGAIRLRRRPGLYRSIGTANGPTS